MRYSEKWKSSLSLSQNLNKVGATLLFALIVTLGTMLPFSYVSQAQAQAGFPLYTWGINNNGQLGRVPNAANRADRPVMIEHGGEGWIDAAAASGGSFAISSQGHLYSWGNNWTSNQMAQGEHPSPGAGNILIPVRVGSASNWELVFARGNNMGAINTEGHLYTWGQTGSGVLGRTGAANIPGRVAVERNWVHFATGVNTSFAITEDGALYAWGSNMSGMLGIFPATGGRDIPTRVGDRNDWQHIATCGSSVLALTTGGALYAWGENYNGELGIGETGGSRSAPTRVGNRYDWADIAKSSLSSAAISNAGNLYTFGSAAFGRLGNGTTTGIVNTPTQIATGPLWAGTTWAAVMGSGNHFMAFTAEGRLYAWGDNGAGQLGLGVTGGNRNVPTFVVQTYGRAETPRGGGLHSMLLMRTTPAEAAFTINKDLRKLQGTTLPSSMTFEFNVAPHSFNGNTNQINQLPTIPSANRSVTITSTSESTTASDITTKEDYTDLFRGVSFAQAGTFAWMISEVENSSQVNTTPPSNLRVNYSEARYEVRVTVVQQGASFVIDGIALLRHVTADGVVLSPPQTVSNHGNELTFTNTFQRWSSGTNTCAGALSVSKEIDGDFVDPATPFLFNVTLTGTALCAAGTEFSARLYGPNNNFIRTESFTVNVPRNNVPILDGQTLVFPYLPVGLEWVVEEQAAEGFTARVERVVNGTTLATITNPHPELLLSTGTHTITAENLRNSAHFTNIHFITPPMGLFLASGVPYAVVGAAGLMLATLLVLRVRVGKKIEDMPAMY